MYFLGQQVVYVDDTGRKGEGLYLHETLPKVGCVYTVRAYVPCRKLYALNEDGLLLEEIVNIERNYKCPLGPVRCELSFRVSRFRPVRTTNIDVFRKMLAPAPVREHELT
jgi:hypothetical protein